MKKRIFDLIILIHPPSQYYFIVINIQVITPNMYELMNCYKPTQSAHNGYIFIFHMLVILISDFVVHTVIMLCIIAKFLSPKSNIMNLGFPQKFVGAGF